MRSVAVKHRCITVRDLTGVVQNDDLRRKCLGLLRGVVLRVTTNVTTADILNGHVLDVETNVVTGDGFKKLLVVHLDRFDLRGDSTRGEGDNHARLDDTSLDTTDGYCANTTNLVDVLERQAERLAGWAGRREDGVQSLEESLALGIATSIILASYLPTLVPGELQKIKSIYRDTNKSCISQPHGKKFLRF